jgi:hypothetical protein
MIAKSGLGYNWGRGSVIRATGAWNVAFSQRSDRAVASGASATQAGPAGAGPDACDRQDTMSRTNTAAAKAMTM